MRSPQVDAKPGSDYGSFATIKTNLSITHLDTENIIQMLHRSLLSECAPMDSYVCEKFERRGHSSFCCGCESSIFRSALWPAGALKGPGHGSMYLSISFHPSVWCSTTGTRSSLSKARPSKGFSDHFYTKRLQTLRTFGQRLIKVCHLGCGRGARCYVLMKPKGCQSTLD